jgi:hypothetical protein
LTEIDIPNPDGALPPGIYCSVELKVPRKTPSFTIPAEALLFNRNGLQVAVVKDGKAEIRTVRVARDLGTRLEVDTGLRAGERVILNPPVTLGNGSNVRPRPPGAGSTTQSIDNWHFGRDAEPEAFSEATREEINMLLHLPIAILTALSPVTVSDTVPNFDTVRGGPSVDVARCSRDEAAALRQLREAWAQYGGADR